MEQLNTKEDILIIDDSAIVADRIARFMKKGFDRRYRIRVAHTYHEGVKILTSLHIHTAFIDILLPGKNGVDLLKLIRKENKPVKKIIMMGDDGAGMQYRSVCLSLGADHIIDKFREPELLEKIAAELCNG